MVTLSEPTDQGVQTAVASNGGLTQMSPQDAKAAASPTDLPFYVFFTEWPVVWNKQVIIFRAGVGYQLDAALLAFLTAQSAPIQAV